MGAASTFLLNRTSGREINPSNPKESVDDLIGEFVKLMPVAKAKKVSFFSKVRLAGSLEAEIQGFRPKVSILQYDILSFLK